MWKEVFSTHISVFRNKNQIGIELILMKWKTWTTEWVRAVDHDTNAQNTSMLFNIVISSTRKYRDYQ